MKRNHIIDPSITVIMETIGCHQDKIARAINSFIAQDYDNAKLLILNHHPSRLVLQNVRENMRWRIEAINIDDVFTRPVDQHMNNLRHVRTDCWTILDDDDWMESGHLSQLVTHWNASANRTNAPLQVCGQNYLAHYADDYGTQMNFKGWAVSLFERLTDEEIAWCFKLFPADMIIGDDTWIAWNSYYDKRLFNGIPTYHWDRVGTCHLSSHETNRNETPREKFEIALNYWRIKLEARSAELNPVNINPQTLTH